MHKTKITICFFILMLLSACETEKTYRNVPQQTWQQLSAEQKQLIVDHSFNEEIQKSKVE